MGVSRNSSSPGLPGTVTGSGLSGYSYCRRLPFVLANCQPSCSITLMTSRTLTSRVTYIRVAATSRQLSATGEIRLKSTLPSGAKDTPSQSSCCLCGIVPSGKSASSPSVLTTRFVSRCWPRFAAPLSKERTAGYSWVGCIAIERPQHRSLRYRLEYAARVHSRVVASSSGPFVIRYRSPVCSPPTASSQRSRNAAPPRHPRCGDRMRPPGS